MTTPELQPSPTALRSPDLLQAAPDLLLAPERRLQLFALLDAIADREEESELLAFAERLGGWIEDRRTSVRRAALEVAGRVLHESRPEVADAFLAGLGAPLRKILLSEHEPAVLDVLPRAAAGWALIAIRGGRWPMLAGFYALAIQPRLDHPSTPVLFARTLREDLSRLAEVPGRHPIVDLVQSGPESLKRIMEPLLPLLGAPLLPVLERTILTAGRESIARGAARSLGRIDPAHATELASRIRPDAPAPLVLRLLEVLDELQPRNFVGAVLAALEHPDPAVSVAALALIGRVERPLAVACLRKGLADPKGARHLALLGLARERGLVELTPELVRLFHELEDERAVLEALRALLVFPTVAALPAFREALERRHGLFHKGLPDEARAAAVQAAAKVDHDEARAIVERARKDRSSTVRRAAPAS